MKYKKMLGILGIGAAALVGASFAYYTQSDSIDNEFKTAKYNMIVTEDFKPKDGEEWMPGEEINKDLTVTNDGDRAIVVRVKFEDIWSRKDPSDGTDKPFHIATGSNVFRYEQMDPYDGLTGDSNGTDKSVVIKTFAPGSFGTGGRWSDLQSDGWYYYLKELQPNESTGIFLDQIQLDPKVDFGRIQTQFYYATVASPSDADWRETGSPQPATSAQITPQKGWTYTKSVTRAKDGFLGYSEADYTLRITVQSVQATDGAVAALMKGAPKDIIDGWKLDKEKAE